MLEALILSGAVGLAVGTYLYLRRPPIVCRRDPRARTPAEEVAARLRAVVPDELIESIEVDLDDRANPIALELAREPTPEERAKIDRACSRAIADLLADRDPAEAEAKTE